ncbi:LysM peptidoglycan-binding domain-containing M23 family metallopeptidase [bacterium]|nr:LysM peptidoglycan-binding domain-containing M23 family metallopeptidase [bacterium]
MKNFCIFIFSALFCLSCATDSFGVYHTVKKGENITKISQLYNVDENELRAENSIPEGVDELKEGSAIFIPGADEVIETSPEPSHEPAPETEPEPAPVETFHETSPETSPEPEPENETTMNFIWPAAGKIVCKFSASSPKSDGIDIEFEKSTDIRAAADGKVIYSAAHSQLGNMVIIQHDNNFITVYAYLHTIFAKEGQPIKQNDVLGIADTTEKKSVPTLHFEVRKESKPVDPVKYLPGNSIS